MKAIKTNAVIHSFRGLSDGSLSLTVHTPELTPEEKAEFMELQNQSLECLFNPLDVPDAPKLKVDKDVRQKSQSTRLYNTLFVLWKQEGEQGDFEGFYKQKMEKFIDIVKDNLE